MSTAPESIQPVKIPRIAITYCTKCKWMLRAAYYAQELLSTFDTAIGEIALIPTVGGIFHISVTHQLATHTDEPVTVLLWDYKRDGGFPETKVLKQRLRDQIQPEKKLGHSDTPSRRSGVNGDVQQVVVVSPENTPAKQSTSQGLSSTETVEKSLSSQDRGGSETKVDDETIAKCEDCQ